MYRVRKVSLSISVNPLAVNPLVVRIHLNHCLDVNCLRKLALIIMHNHNFILESPFYSSSQLAFPNNVINTNKM